MQPQQTDVLRWKLRARSPEYKRHLDASIQTIHRAHQVAEFVLSWSAGKDSTVMVHLVRSLYPDVPIMIQFDDCDWPETRPYSVRVASAQGWDHHVVEPDFSVWERMAAGRIGEEAFCSQAHSLTQDSFLKPLAKKQAELGCNGVYMGLRANESKARNLHLMRRGELYQIEDGEWRCCPLAKWTSEDVFAYMIQHDIEINPCYLHNKFLPPDDIRLSWAVPTPTSMSHGDLEHYRHYYPAQFQKLRDLGVR